MQTCTYVCIATYLGAVVIIVFTKCISNHLHHDLNVNVVVIITCSHVATAFSLHILQ